MAASRRSLPKSFVWSKIGTEAGEKIEVILRRKETERQACDGVFYWGVGNSIGSAARQLTSEERRPKVIFSHMRSKPKKVDETPGKIILWLAYQDSKGLHVPLPELSFVTSRSSGKKRSHYALVCRSNSEIDGGEYGNVDAAQLVNFSSRRRLGYSQVTSAVRVAEHVDAKPMEYPIAFVASLEEPGQVKLVEGVEIDQHRVKTISELALRGDVAGWKQAVAQAKADLRKEQVGNASATSSPAQLRLLEAF